MRSRRSYSSRERGSIWTIDREIDVDRGSTRAVLVKAGLVVARNVDASYELSPPWDDNSAEVRSAVRQ